MLQKASGLKDVSCKSCVVSKVSRVNGVWCQGAWGKRYLVWKVFVSSGLVQKLFGLKNVQGVGCKSCLL